MLEVLERLGSPEVVAAAAYEEAGTQVPVRAPVTTFVHRRGTSSWVRALVIAAIAFLVLLVITVLLLFAGARGGSVSESPVPVPVAPAAVPPR